MKCHTGTRLGAMILLSTAIACGGGLSGPAATTDTPSGTITLFVRAIEKGDIETYVNLLPAADRRKVEVAREAMGSQYDETLKSALGGMKRTIGGGEVVGEEINGERATVTLKLSSGVEAGWDCVKEDDGWKVAMSG